VPFQRFSSRVLPFEVRGRGMDSRPAAALALAIGIADGIFTIIADGGGPRAGRVENGLARIRESEGGKRDFAGGEAGTRLMATNARWAPR
jgi:hypothetical protein